VFSYQVNPAGSAKKPWSRGIIALMKNLDYFRCVHGNFYNIQTAGPDPVLWSSRGPDLFELWRSRNCGIERDWKRSQRFAGPLLFKLRNIKRASNQRILFRIGSEEEKKSV
jgi:hypothetical protein